MIFLYPINYVYKKVKMSSITIDFDFTLSQDDIQFMKEQLTKLNNNFKIVDKPVTELRIIENNCSFIPSFPESLKTLKIIKCPNLTSLPPLPKSLKVLDISNCENITSLPMLPSTLNEILIDSCPKLTSIPELPEIMSICHIYDTPISSISYEKSKICSLDLRNTNIQILPEVINYEYLRISNNPVNKFYNYDQSYNYYGSNIISIGPEDDIFFYKDYEPITNVLRQMLNAGIPFDTIVKDFESLNYYERTKEEQEFMRRKMMDGIPFQIVKTEFECRNTKVLQNTFGEP